MSWSIFLVSKSELNYFFTHLKVKYMIMVKEKLNMVRGGKRGYSTGCGLYLVRLKMSRFNLYQIIFYRAGWIVCHTVTKLIKLIPDCILLSI